MSLRDQVNTVLRALTDARGAALGQSAGILLESRENSAVLKASPADLPENLDELAEQYFEQWGVGTFAVRLDIVAGDRQTARSETEIDEPIQFRVVDSTGRSVAGAVVYFAPTRGSGAIRGSRTTSDNEGMAFAEGWRLGKPGENQLVATVVGSGHGNVSATARALSLRRGRRDGTLTKTSTARPGE